MYRKEVEKQNRRVGMRGVVQIAEIKETTRRK